MVKIKCCNLRTLSFRELCKQLEDLKNELLELRIAKISGGPTCKLSKIRVLRKAIARTYIVFNQKRKETLRLLYDKDKFKPLDLRKRRTRSMRKAMIKSNVLRKSRKEKRKKSIYPKRKFAVKI